MRNDAPRSAAADPGEAAPVLRMRHDPNARPGSNVLRLRRAEGEILSVPRPTQEQLRMEEAFLAGVRAHEQRIPFGCANISAAEFYKRFRYRHPEVFWLSREYYISRKSRAGEQSIKPVYHYSPEEIEAIQRQLDATLDEIHARLRGCREPFERIRRVYDWFVENTRYVDDGRPERYTAVGPLRDRQAVCMGLSMAFMLACLRENISCGIVTGSADLNPQKPSNHCWNIVRLEGAAYHIDLTAGLSYYAQTRAICYPVFMLPESELALSRCIDVPSGYPESQTYKYTCRMGTCFSSEDAMLRWALRQKRPGSHTISGETNAWANNDSYQAAVLRCLSRCGAGRGYSYTPLNHYMTLVRFH